MMPIYLHALALQNFRGIGPEIQKLTPFRDFNFFIGANNAGKSTILDFLHRFLVAKKGKRPAPTGLDLFTGENSGPSAAMFGIPVEEFIRKVPPHKERFNAVIEKLCRLVADDNTVWLTLPFGAESAQLVNRPNVTDVRGAKISDREMSAVWTELTSRGAGDINEHWIPQTYDSLISTQNTKFPPVQIIPAIRQIGQTSEEFSDLSGRGLIDKLAAIQSPDHDKRAERELFNSINRFLQTVTGRHNAEIEIPHNRAHVLVHMDNKVLPLSSLGTGIHEVIMIAAFCTLICDQIVCIEEPELHLHPLLQRKLIDYLQKNTENQYFVATHSPSFIDTERAAIFHVSTDGVQTRIKESILRSERFAICTDLGIKASDLLQSNAIIWVEGPSDRIYIRHWMKTVAPELVEGIHFSIMFYGGRLLSHLSADDDEIGEFIALRSLNRYLAIVIDSDKSDSGASINDTKERLRTELDKKPGLVWITAGREIENYIEHSTLQNAVKASHPGVYGAPKSGGVFDHALYFDRTDGKVEQRPDKVKIAKHICDQPADLDVLDLKDRVIELIEMVRKANSLSSSP